MIKVFVTLVLCSCMKDKIWPTTNNGSIDDIPTTKVPCSHDSSPVTSSPIDNTTSITSLQDDNITLTSLPFDEIPSTTSLPVSNITSTVLFPVVNITLTPTASIYNITRLSPEVVDHTPFITTELANDIPTVTDLVDNITSIPPSLIETVTSKTTEFINDTSLTITELSNHITSSPTEFLDNITSVTPSSVGNTSSMSTEFINNFILTTTTKLVNHINLATESAFNISTTPSLVDNITSSIARLDGNNTSSTTELVNNTLLTTILLPVNDITLTTSSPYNFTSSTEEIVDNVTSTTEETFDNITLMTEPVNNTTSTTESVNDIISMTPSPFNFSSTIEEMIDNITLPTMKTLDNITSTTKYVNNITSTTSSPPSFKSTDNEEIIDNATLTAMKIFDNIKPITPVLVNDSAISSLLPSDSIILSRLFNGYSEILTKLSPTYNPISAAAPPPPPPKYDSKKLKVYWNVPTFVCHRYGMNFEDISKFGIIQNVNDTFRGKDVAILYDPGLFPALIKSSNGSIIIRNGGVPQKGDLQKHLKAFKKDIDLQIDLNFSGVGIIDFEHWRPILRLNWAALNQYRKYSYKIEKEENPDLNEAEIKTLAAEKFEKHARAFMEETIKMAKTLRPKASWSYYGFPWCNNLTPKHKSTQCHPMFIENNDDIQWLWNLENVLLPSIYIPMHLDSDKRVGLIKGRLNEAQRIARKTDSQPKILPYFWFKYRDHRDVFLSRDDLIRAFEEMLNQNIDGFILWGSSNDVNTKAKCQQVHDYMNQVFGPLVKEIIINQRVVNNEVFEK